VAYFCSAAAGGGATTRPVCAKESWSMETRGTTLWCVVGGWYVGTVEAGSLLLRERLVCVHPREGSGWLLW
jgi:hypothetical protein